MKKVICFSLVVLLCAAMYGQTATPDTTSVTKYSYCEIVGATNMLQTKVTITIDFGQVTKFFADNRYKDPATSKPYTFNSMVDALNFMGKQGWDFAAAYTIGNAQNGYVYHFLLKKLDTDNKKE
jgi:hypothetical protein